MKTCIRIKGQDGQTYMPMLQFEYDNIQKPVVFETDEKFIISYYRAEEYWEIDDAWLSKVYCNIIGECRGYFDPHQIKSYWDEEEEMPEFFTYDEDGERTGFKLPDGYPEYAVQYLAGYAHSNVVWRETSDVNNVDAVLWMTPEAIEELRAKYDEAVVHDMILADFKRCRRILDGDQFYTHMTIEITKYDMRSDDMGMVTYLFDEHCTREQLTYHLPGEECEYELIPLIMIIDVY